MLSLIISTYTAILSDSDVAATLPQGLPDSSGISDVAFVAGGHAEPVKAAAEPARDTVRFAHRSEAEFAKILDFYGIRWEYEPRSFPLEWDERGRVVESFNPDFYLPELDLFIELTTLKQSLVTRKNRKLRRLRELYPGVHIKIFYGRDFRQLLLKYGLQPTAAAR
jgi:hypothetical protein